MARSLFSTRPRRQTFLDRYLDEEVEYGGEWCRRIDVIRDLKRCGLDDRCVDRYLQGMELRQELDIPKRSENPECVDLDSGSVLMRSRFSLEAWSSRPDRRIDDSHDFRIRLRRLQNDLGMFRCEDSKDLIRERLADRVNLAEVKNYHGE